MIKDAARVLMDLKTIQNSEAILTFVPRVDPITKEKILDQPVPKLTLKNPAVFPKNPPQGIIQGRYIPGKLPNNKFEMQELQREWAVISRNANLKDCILDEWPPMYTPIVVQIEERMTFAEGMLIEHHYRPEGDLKREIVFMELVRDGGFEYVADAPVKYGIDGDVQTGLFIPVEMKRIMAWAYLSLEGQIFHQPRRWNRPIDIFADCEFDDTTKTLLSVGITAKNGTVHYAWDAQAAHTVENEWVKEHVLPVLLDVPPGTHVTDLNAQNLSWSSWLESVMIAISDEDPLYSEFVLHVDFPTDVEYISKLLHLGGGQRIGQMRDFTFKIDYVDAYPTQLKGAVQHNAAWDSLAIWLHLGYLSYRVFEELGKPTNGDDVHVEPKKLPPLVDSMIQGVLKVKPEEMERLQEGLENPAPVGAKLNEALKRFREKK